jgi:glycosyltransferase involved in cell wall biosynthesis
MSLNRGERVLLFVGRLEVTKGLRELLEAVSRLSKTRQNIRLVLLGGGLAKETLRRTLAELALERVVQFVPVSPPRDVARWMAASDLLVLPSYAEGCPNVVVEALNCGCPVVATDVGGIPDLVPDECGILVPPRDADRLTLALEIALERKWDQDRIASSARRSWEDVAREIYQLCSSLMPQQSRTSAQARKASFAR